MELIIETNNNNNNSMCRSSTQSASQSQTPILITIPENIDHITPSTRGVKRKSSVRSVTSTYKKRNEILTEMKNDLKNYYDEKSMREQEKLVLERKKHEERVRRTSILQEYISTLRRNKFQE